MALFQCSVQCICPLATVPNFRLIVCGSMWPREPGSREQGVQGPAEFLTWHPGNFSALQSPFDIAIHGSSLFDEQKRRTPSTLGPWAFPPPPVWWYIISTLDSQTASIILHTYLGT